MSATEGPVVSTGEQATARLLDLLLPGSGGWPPASAVVAPADWLSRLEPADAALAQLCAGGVGDAVESNAISALQALERAEPVPFRCLLLALYEAYYTTAPVQARLAEMAEAGPREPSAHVDPTLVSRVLQTGAGRRRL